ncbi:hypothetical protein DSM106972_048930 [Dulcicalothrix desertica PCC 7102]|uniref:FtsK domain-containing protein n=1 Tax=Dulcicalothrix desertica PCC 7102 TaxID=232991 RepID=A0A433VD96_9CYAN|nr:DNA translocase FtsK [Dulcicalothrix desertica]RUT03979.1 hypothetical protein DSM106972_048930 [Dulcicalothrix desertica PCC 7102]TWH43615.1 S-DNA-T family DNA segregation ATPase FtsK/SpoIIIE [Dulcicalothrix desertica PCC 7102]
MYLPVNESNIITSESNPLLTVVLSAKQQGYDNQEIIQEAQRVAECNGDYAGYQFVLTTINQIEFLEKLNRPTIAYNREFLFNAIYQSVLSGMGNADIISICGEYCNLDDFAFCQLTLEYILVNRIPSDSEQAHFLRTVDSKSSKGLEVVCELFVGLKNIYLTNLLRKVLENYIYQLYVVSKPVEYFLDLREKIADNWVRDRLKRVASLIAKETCKELDFDVITGVTPTSAPKSLEASDAVDEIIKSSQVDLNEAGELVVSVLKDFKIETEFVGAKSGPTFNRIELKLARGTKFSSVANFGDDLVQQLGMELGIKIPPMVSSVCGRTAIDIPRIDREIAYFRDHVDFENEIDINRICIPGGIDVNGNFHWINLCDDNITHVIGSGRTRSGKSQFLKGGVLYLARKYPPSVVRLALSDVKRVTLGKFKNLPHLMAPVCKDAKSTADMLEFLVAEMELRYQEFDIHEDEGIENIAQYNRFYLGRKVMPRVVCWVDEAPEMLADEAYTQRVETALSTLLRKAGAAGIHLLVYSQRPDRDAIKPQIRSNFPCKTAFAAARPEDSYIALADDKDRRAFHLLGRGDFILRTNEFDERLQAPYLADDEDVEYFRCLLSEAINQHDPYVAWESELTFDNFVKQLYLNKGLVDPNAVDRIVTTKEIKIQDSIKNKPLDNADLYKHGEKVEFRANYDFNVEFDAEKKNQILGLHRRGYGAEEIVKEIFGDLPGGRNGDRKFTKLKNAVERYIRSLNEEGNL